MTTEQQITVLGSGTMGAGIAQVAATAGYRTVLYDVDLALAEKAILGIRSRLDRLVEKGKMDGLAAAAALNRLSAAAHLEDSVQTAAMVIEAIPEILSLKQKVMSAVAKAAPATAVLGTNTSTLMISAIAEGLDPEDRSRLIGIHFFNPVPVMKLIEVVMGPDTSEATYEATMAVAAAMEKETVRVRESPGFTTSRINALIGNEAFRMLEAGVASASDIDKALRLGLNHPMGPFEMVDLVGLDARLNNLRALYEALGDEAYRPSELLERLVEAGRLGKKSGRGVYRYDASGQRIPNSDDLS
ncbi:MAG TPA: 3-hydroxyacyl-CoA dehydrogenase NAD-binding domain-containing protein [Planctomycetota bacterium]|jgi:3-hydroxybutyryl-CoA dehydrogenase|nr:3-hydroxyacyl-CoA dehydrogenase NAD-binding domain-containing protein [Planctomycetota bacterium]